MKVVLAALYRDLSKPMCISWKATTYKKQTKSKTIKGGDGLQERPMGINWKSNHPKKELSKGGHGLRERGQCKHSFGLLQPTAGELTNCVSKCKKCHIGPGIYNWILICCTLIAYWLLILAIVFRNLKIATQGKEFKIAHLFIAYLLHIDILHLCSKM